MAGFAAPVFSWVYQGQIAASGSVNVYQTGTTTPVTIYADGALTTPLSNPLTLDSNGQCKFYVSGSVNLRMDGYTATGTFIESIDPVFPVGSPNALPGNNTITNAILAQMNGLTIKGNNSASLGNAADLTVAQTLALLGLNVLPRAISGFVPSAITGNNTTAAVTIAGGRCTDSTNTSIINAPAAPYSWAASNGNAINGTDAVGATLANSTTYHFFACSGTLGVGFFASASIIPTFPAGYNTAIRRVFSLNTTAAGALIPVTAFEGAGGCLICYLVTQLLDINVATLGTAQTLYTLTVPTGIRVQVLYRSSKTADGKVILLTSGDETDVAPTGTSALAWSTAPGSEFGDNTVIATIPRDGLLTTNISGQIGARSGSASTTLHFVTRGFIDFRRAL